MNGFTETSTDGLALDWQPHCLQDLALHKRLDLLALEPSLRSGEPAEQNLLALAVDHRGLRWDWGDWDAVELVAGELSLTRRRSDPPEATWVELGDRATVQVTARRRDGVAGATRLVERPRPRVRFDFQDDLVQVVVEGAPASASFRAELCEIEADKEVRPPGRAWALRRRGAFHQATFAPGSQVFGAIAVVESGGDYARLIGWLQWAYGRPVEPGRGSQEGSPIEAKLRAIFDQGRDQTARAAAPARGFPAWPRRTADRLEWLAARADWLAGGGPEALGSLTGTFRALLLRELGASWASISRDLAERLEAGTFSEALARLHPRLPAALERLQDPAARLWVLRHANEPELDELVRLGGNDASRLDRACEAAGLWPRLDALDAKVCDEVKPRVRQLRDEVERYLAIAGSLAAARRAIQQLEEQVERETSGQPWSEKTGPEPPPAITAEGRQAQELCRSNREAWRRGLARILAYCATGRWEPPDGPDRQLETAELRKRLAGVAEPATPRQPDVAVAEAVEAEIGRLEETAAHETDPDLHREALRFLRATVLPRAGHWAGLRREVDEERRRRPAFPWLDKELPAPPATADLAARAAAARRFLDLVEQIERQAAAQSDGWRVRLPEGVLATPGHVRADQLIQEIDHMRGELATPGEEVDAALPPFALGGQAMPEERLAAWWQHLERIRGLHTLLAARYSSHRSNLESLDPVLVPARGAAAFWQAQPESVRPAYAAELIDLARRAYAGGVSALGALPELTRFLGRHPTVQNDWLRARSGGGTGWEADDGLTEEERA
jgi:hypothetical protein